MLRFSSMQDNPIIAKEALLAPYASKPSQSQGRLHPEMVHPTRSAFQHDRDRIIHSGAFRRLEYKTQVFVNHEGDHYRTRLTHSLEVSQLARSMARMLRLEEDLAEALALAHDLGHTPFGHAGEEALNQCMQPYGGFDHNAQSIRILTRLEQRYAAFDGLNLCWEVLEGIAKHNGPLVKADGSGKALPRALQAYQQQHDLGLDTWPGAEAQVAAIADDIAYHSHDIEDGLRANLLSLEEVASMPVVGDAYRSAIAQWPNLSRQRLIHEMLRRFISGMVQDVHAESLRLLEASGADSPDAVRNLEHAVVDFSAEMKPLQKELKAYLMRAMYRHYKVNRMTSKARRIVTELFELFMAEPECLPPEWQHGASGSQELAESVCDYIAGMTDRFAMQEHGKLFDLSSGDYKLT